MKNKQLSDDNLNNNLKRNDLDFGDFKNVKQNSPWFQCDYQTYRNYSDYISSFYENHLINPAIYEKFNELNDTKLFILVGEYDFLLDNSNQLAKVWEGDLTFDIISNLIHGFLSMKNVSNENKESASLIIKRFQESCDLI